MKKQKNYITFVSTVLLLLLLCFLSVSEFELKIVVIVNGICWRASFDLMMMVDNDVFTVSHDFILNENLENY